jgi:hypothetical protein
MRRKGELENVGEDKNTIINKTFCEQYSKFQQEYTLGIPILMNLQLFASRWNPLLPPPSSHKSSSSSPTFLQLCSNTNTKPTPRATSLSTPTQR